MEAVTITNARQNIAKLMDEVVNNSEVKIITRNNEKAVVMMSLDDYNSWMETCYLLSNPNNAAHLRRAMEQDAAGEYVNAKIEDL